jgi:hypothetical protein
LGTAKIIETVPNGKKRMEAEVEIIKKEIFDLI